MKTNLSNKFQTTQSLVCIIMLVCCAAYLIKYYTPVFKIPLSAHCQQLLFIHLTFTFPEGSFMSQELQCWISTPTQVIRFWCFQVGEVNFLCIVGSTDSLKSLPFFAHTEPPLVTETDTIPCMSFSKVKWEGYCNSQPVLDNSLLFHV